MLTIQLPAGSRLCVESISEERSVHKKIAILLAGLFTVAFLHAQMAPSHFDEKTWWDYVKVLADDNMQGRETGSPGLRKAQAFVVDQLKRNGLEPAAVNG